MVASLLIVGLWWLIAHNAGSGWVQVIGDVVFGALLIGIVGPCLVVARARVLVRSAPTDGVAGLPVEIRIESRMRLRIRPVEPPGPDVFIGPRRGRMAADHVVTLKPSLRGVHDTITLDVASAAPFALQWWTKRLHTRLPSTLYVSPRRGRPDLPRRDPDEGDGDAFDRTRSDAGLSRGARPYVAGDSRRRVHWRSTAHAGRLMVRELERPAAEPVTIVVELPADPERAERAAETALGTVVCLLESGAPVLLSTVESSGPVLAAVTDRRGAGRRLARAVARPGEASAIEGGQTP